MLFIYKSIKIYINFIDKKNHFCGIVYELIE